MFIIIKNRVFLLTAVFLTAFFVSNNALAHPGGTDSSGCHTCRTNCSSWGLYSGEYHCHNAKSSPQPYEPITSTYGAGGTGYTSPAPQYKAPSYTASKPSCPSMASYDSVSDSCKCFSGYVTETNYAGDQTCISGSSKCQKELGYGSRYDSISKNCECDYGYILSNGKCVSESKYCNDTLGYNSKYNSLRENCECNYGYKMSNNKCISEDDYCDDILGKNSKYNSIDEKCECDFGYEFDGTDCIEDKEVQESYMDSNKITTLNNISDNKDMNDIAIEDNETGTGIIQEKKENEIQDSNNGFSSRIRSFFRRLRFW
jgi:hypothetical protein